VGAQQGGRRCPAQDLAICPGRFGHPVPNRAIDITVAPRARHVQIIAALVRSGRGRRSRRRCSRRRDLPW
jgi:hypothetical protein